MMHETFIELGRRYRDHDTEFEGVANSVAFYRNACERVQLKALISSVPVEHWFDAPALTLIEPDAKTVGFDSKSGNGVS